MNAELKNLLVQRLESIGLDRSVIPGFLKSFSNVLFIDQNLNLGVVNRHLNLIGWNDIELDYYTYELARICLEAEGITDLEYKPSIWFENAFMAS